MNFPPLLIGSAALFWGIENDRLLIGAIIFILLEARWLVSTRYDLTAEDFVKISDLTSLLFIAAIALILLNYEPLRFMRITAGWMPVVLVPLIAAQLYSTGETVTIGTQLGKSRKMYAHKPIDFRAYYIVACVFAAATGNSGSISFLIGTGGIFAVLFYANRGRAYSPFAFILALILLVCGGYLGSIAIEKANRYIAGQSISFFYNYYRDKYSDPFKTNVHFGETGRLKSSGQIVMRVEAEPPLSHVLLKTVSYDKYLEGAWFSDQRGFQFLLPIDRENWNLVPPPHPDGRKLHIEYNLPREKGLMPLPLGSFHLNSQTVYELLQHDNGNARVRDGAEVISYTVKYSSESIRSSDSPLEDHLQVPKKEKYVLDRLAVELEPGTADWDKVGSVIAFFQGGFSYSLSLVGSGDYPTPLGNFLLSKKQGFCEYYATATALLLRRLGIPSRYVIGYSAAEKSQLEGKIVVRKRHAHAWVEAYVDGAWQTVDTTPPDWFSKDGENRSFFEPVRDLFSYIKHKYDLYRTGTGEDYTLYYSLVVVVLTAFLIFRIYRRMKLEQAGKEEEQAKPRQFERIITPLTPVIDFLESSTRRHSGEPYGDWAARASLQPDVDRDEFTSLCRLHLRLRFDPAGLVEEDLLRLQKGAKKYHSQFLESEKLSVS